MKKIINGKRYDTETAREVADYYHGSVHSDFTYYEESLYCKKTGEYFLAGNGGPMTKYAVSVDQNYTSGGSAIEPLTSEKAHAWAEQHMDADDYEAEFGPVVEDAPASSYGAKIKAMREAAGLTQEDLAKLIPMPRVQLSRYETGEQDPTVGRLERILSVLGAHLEIRG